MNKSKYISLICMFLLACLPLFAQPGDPDANNTVPIDGGISLLAAAGLAYGAKKIVDKRKESKPD